MKVKDIQKIIKNNIIAIICFTIIGGLVGACYAKLNKRTTYSAQTNILIGHNLSRTNHPNSTVQADLSMMDSYRELLKDKQVLNKARKELPKNIRKDYTAADIEHSLSVDNKPQTLVLNVRVTTSSANDSTSIVNAISKAAQKELPKIKPGIGNVRTLSFAKKNDATSKTSPSIKIYLVLGAALGLLVGMIVSFSLTTLKNFS